jgi:hypothetical protein
MSANSPNSFYEPISYKLFFSSSSSSFFFFSPNNLFNAQVEQIAFVYMIVRK